MTDGAPDRPPTEPPGGGPLATGPCTVRVTREVLHRAIEEAGGYAALVAEVGDDEPHLR